jgi:hypothetical protein
MKTYRDEQLGSALRELDVPEHRAGFHAELEGLLDDVPPTAPSSTPRRFPVALPVAVAAIAVLALGVSLFASRVAGPEVASAAEVKARVRASLREMRNLSGAFVFDCTERGCPGRSGERRWRFTLSANGDLLLLGPAPGETIAYDATSGIVRSAQRSASAGGDTLFYAERRGVAPGPPDLGPPTWVLPDEFGAFVRALLAAEDPGVREASYDGRPAWQLEVDAVPNAIVPDFTGDRFEIMVDRESGFPVRVVERGRGSLLRELRVERLAVNADLPRDTFRLQFPAGSEVARTDDGFRRVRLDETEAIVGYLPLVPTWVPAGFELAEIAVAAESGPTGTESGNPLSRDVVSLSYRRGLDQLLVTTRRRGTARWSDPLATGEGFVDEPERVVIRDGALRDVTAELVVAPRGVPHLWALTDDLVVTVAGDLGRSELVRVAESALP